TTPTSSPATDHRRTGRENASSATRRPSQFDEEATGGSAAREAEDAVGDDRALDLGGAAGDRGGVAPEPLSLPAALEGCPVALDEQGDVGEVLGHVGPGQLDPARLGPG